MAPLRFYTSSSPFDVSLVKRRDELGAKPLSLKCVSRAVTKPGDDCSAANETPISRQRHPGCFDPCDDLRVADVRYPKKSQPNGNKYIKIDS
jgi:hypothetical protein